MTCPSVAPVSVSINDHRPLALAWARATSPNMRGFSRGFHRLPTRAGDGARVKPRSFIVVVAAVLLGVALTLAITRLVRPPLQSPVAPVTIGVPAPVERESEPSTEERKRPGDNGAVPRRESSERRGSSSERSSRQRTTPSRVAPARTTRRTGTRGSFTPVPRPSPSVPAPAPPRPSTPSRPASPAQTPRPRPTPAPAPAAPAPAPTDDGGGGGDDEPSGEDDADDD